MILMAASAGPVNRFIEDTRVDIACEMLGSHIDWDHRTITGELSLEGAFRRRIHEHHVSLDWLTGLTVVNRSHDQQSETCSFRS